MSTSSFLHTHICIYIKSCRVDNLGYDFCVCFPAGVAFYSISDIADRLLSTPAHPMPSLEEGYWLSRCTSDPSGLLYTLLEELSPAAMAAFDLACCHCQLWKTSRQLLDTAERRLNSSLEAQGRISACFREKLEMWMMYCRWCRLQKRYILTWRLEKDYNLHN